MKAPWIDFLNSDARDHRGHGHDEDRLDDPRWRDSFLETWSLDDLGARPARAIATLRKQRAIIRRMVETLVAGRTPTRRDLASLNEYLGARPVVPRLYREDGAFRVRLEPTATGIDAVLFTIAASFAEFLADGDPTRVKLCENEHCKWVFYDETRSRTRRWCAESCGNLVKVRRFRERQRRKR